MVADSVAAFGSVSTATTADIAASTLSSSTTNLDWDSKGWTFLLYVF